MSRAATAGRPKVGFRVFVVRTRAPGTRRERRASRARGGGVQVEPRARARARWATQKYPRQAKAPKRSKLRNASATSSREPNRWATRRGTDAGDASKRGHVRRRVRACVQTTSQGEAAPDRESVLGASAGVRVSRWCAVPGGTGIVGGAGGGERGEGREQRAAGSRNAPHVRPPQSPRAR